MNINKKLILEYFDINFKIKDITKIKKQIYNVINKIQL